MTEAILIAGGNRGDVEAALGRVRALIGERAGTVTRCSGLYRSPAWGFDSAEFTNRVFVVETALPPEKLLETAIAIENELGRDRRAEEDEKKRTGQPYGSRTMDIDILFYDDRTVDLPGLKIPHPLFRERRFVLEPLAEAAPEKIDPVSGKTAAELLGELSRREAGKLNEK